MNINKVTASFDESCLKEVESALLQHGVKGFTLYPVRGRGYNFDSFNEKKHLIKHIQLEVYVKTDQAKAIAQVIVEAAHVNAKDWSALFLSMI